MPHLCFLNKGIRLKSSFLCVTWLFVCTLDRRIGNEDYASWERGKGKEGCACWVLRANAHGEVGVSFGTVPVEHKDLKKSNEMYYHRFTKVIIHHFMLKDPSIPRRNKVNWHYVRDDYMFSIIKLVSRHQNTQQFSALLPIELTNEDIRNSNAYKEYYAVATGATPPKPKASVRKTRSSSDTTITPPTAAAEAQQLKLVTKRSLQQTHLSQASGSGANEGTSSIPGVPDVLTDDSKEELSWNSTEDEGDDEGNDGDGEEGNGDGENDDDKDDDGEEGDDDDDDQEVEWDDEEEYDEETRDGESFDPIPKTPENNDEEDNGEEDLGLNVGREEGHDEEEEEDELYKDQSSSVSSQFVTSILNPTLNVGMESIFETTSQMGAQTPTSVAPLPIMQKIIKEQVKKQVKVQVSKILPKIEQTVNEQLKAEVLTRSSHSSKTSYVVAADLSERELKKILIKKIEGNKSIQRSDEQRNHYKALVEAYEFDKIILDTYGENVTLKRRRDDDADKDEEPSAGPDRGSKRRTKGKEPESVSAPKEKATRSTGKSTQGTKYRQASASEYAIVKDPMQTTFQFELAKQFDSRSSFNELMDTPLDFFNFLINRLKVDTLTPELIAGPTYELLKGSCKSLVKLKYHLEEVFKAITDQLDWVNPEGQQYPHNLLKPLALIPNTRGRLVIPFEHFINNDLEYLRGGASSRKYTTSVTKTKAADYGHIKWIEDLFYGFAVNRKSACDVYSKRRIIAITEFKIVEWHNYKHLDWITVRRDDDKLYKFKEGDFKRLRIQDIKDMLLLLVQGKLTNLIVKERFAFNVSLRMFTRSIVIQRRVEDLQLGVESYQKKLNLTKPDTYRSNLKRKEAYTAYSNPRGFIHQNKDKKNRLTRIEELHKFSNGTLTDVRIVLDDRLKGIRMKYLP
nr:hypothetical protein [Tanacetum cinerariifolium]